MGGGLMQLVAYGAQDIYLTGNPQITFFKVVYRRHTNFATESIEQTFTGSVDFGRKISATIDRNGDLLYKMYLEVDLDVGADGRTKAGVGTHPLGIDNLYANRLGHAMIREVSVEIGGQCMDTHYGEWLELWSQLSMGGEEIAKHRTLIDGDLLDTARNNRDANGIITSDQHRKLYIPLQFWFNRNPGLALPLIALQYHEVKINVFLETAEASGFANDSGAQISQICLFCDYVFLDTDERRRFAQVSHEYLIEQLQFNNIVSIDGSEACANIELRFNHPCKDMVWTVQPQIQDVTSGRRLHPFDWSRQSAAGTGTTTTQQQQGSGTGGALDNMLKAKLQLNGHDRFRERQGTYFRCVQPFQHYTGGFLQSNGAGNDPTAVGNAIWADNGFFYVYSFALKPEEHQPSGTCNFSRIDNATLQTVISVTKDADGNLVDDLDLVPRFVRVYATNYNVLRIMSGMGGLAYSN